MDIDQYRFFSPLLLSCILHRSGDCLNKLVKPGHSLIQLVKPGHSLIQLLKPQVLSVWPRASKQLFMLSLLMALQRAIEAVGKR